MCASWRGASSKRNCIGTSNAKNRDLYCFLTMEMNERGYKIKGPPIEMHYAVIPMGPLK